MRGGREGCLQIPIEEKKRLEDLLDEGNNALNPFVILETDRHRVALNLDHPTFCQFLFDISPRTTDDLNSKHHLRVTLAEPGLPIDFGIEHDSVSLEDDPGADKEAQIQNLFSAVVGQDPDEMLSFVDHNGEQAYFRCGDIAMIEVPIEAVDLSKQDMEPEDSEDEPEPAPRV